MYNKFRCSSCAPTCSPQGGTSLHFENRTFLTDFVSGFGVVTQHTHTHTPARTDIRHSWQPTILLCSYPFCLRNRTYWYRSSALNYKDIKSEEFCVQKSTTHNKTSVFSTPQRTAINSVKNINMFYIATAN